MKNKKTVKAVDIKENIESSLNEINNIENLISEILVEDNFNKLNIMQSSQNLKERNLFPEIKLNPAEADSGNLEFVSIDINSLSLYNELITEKEFYAIVEAGVKGLSKRAGRYQEKLYGHYILAKKECDEGYIRDVLQKAIVFRDELKYVKALSENKKFMKEWRKDFGHESPVANYKHYGNLRDINIIEERLK